MALALGVPDVDALLAQLTSRQLAEWMAFGQLEPFGEVRADLRAAIVASTIANAFSVKGRRFKPADFLPRFEKPKSQPAAVMRANFRAFIAAAERTRPQHGHHRPIKCDSQS